MFKTLKKQVPRSLYHRALLILILPTILAQAFAVYMFYERHWDNVSRHLAASLAGEVTTIVSYIENSPDDYVAEQFLKRARNLFSLTPLYVSKDVADAYVVDYKPIKLSTYRNRLKSQIGNNFDVFRDESNNKILTRVNLNNGKVLLVEVSTKRLFNSSTYIFVIWMIGSTLLLTIIAVVFLRNQIRPIIRLARLADNFGRGQELPQNFKPEGAKEIRQAANAFLLMRERLSRHIRQRTEMLAGISHDLRTPLTRMKLELAMLQQKEPSEALAGLESDIKEMESMVNSYLEFVRGDEGEESQEADLSDVIKGVVAKYVDTGANVKFEAPSKPLRARVKPLQIARVVRNLIDNALKFGTRAEVSLITWQQDGSIMIIVDDDGSGIPATMREEVFKPFFRLEQSRNKETGGIGLGLSIVRDIAHAHGGTVELGESPLGGLRAMIRLPE